MLKKEWEALLSRLTINNRMGKRMPVGSNELDAFEAKFNVKLPSSYREYCKVFGPGEFGKQFKIAVPGCKGKAKNYSLEYFENLAHEGVEYEIYSNNPDQHKRGIFFGMDIVGSYYFFDPAEITDQESNEYPVYRLSSAFDSLQQICATFWEFVTEFCLGENHDQLIQDLPAEHVFMPVG